MSFPKFGGAAAPLAPRPIRLWECGKETVGSQVPPFFAPATSPLEIRKGKMRKRTVGKRRKNIGHLFKGTSCFFIFVYHAIQH